MAKTTPRQNNALVVEAFDALLNKRDYAAAELAPMTEVARISWQLPSRACKCTFNPMSFARIQIASHGL
jgi:hypothetical protein